MDSYKIVRKFKESGRSYTIDRNMDLDDAKAWCNSPDSSSSTCTTKAGIRRTATKGPWFDMFYKQ